MTGRNKQTGFTLIELLVAFSIMSALTVLMAGAFRGIAQAEARIDSRLARLDDQRVVHGLLHQLLSRGSGRQNLFQDAQTSRRQAQFRGATDVVEWLGIMPVRPGIAGRFFFRLQIEKQAEVSALVLRFAPWSLGQYGFPAWSSAESRVLVTDVSAFDVEYQVPIDLPAYQAQAVPGSWVSDWVGKSALPARIRIRYTDGHDVQSDLAIPIHELVQGATSRSGFTIGGAAR